MLTPTQECKRLATANPHPHMLLSTVRITKSSAWNSRHLTMSLEIWMPGLFPILVSPCSSDEVLILCWNISIHYGAFSQNHRNQRLVWTERDPPASWSPTLKWMACLGMEPKMLVLLELHCNQLSPSQGIFLCFIVIYLLYHTCHWHSPVSKGKRESLSTKGICHHYRHFANAYFNH